MEIVTTAELLTKYIKKEPKELLNPFKNIITEGQEDEKDSNDMLDLDSYFHLVKQHSDSKNDQNNKKNIRFKLCLATVVSYNDNYYALTCYHGIQDYEAMYLLLHVKEGGETVVLKVTEMYSIRQYDFSVLEFNDNIAITKTILKIKRNSDIKMKYDFQQNNNNKDNNILKINYFPNKNETFEKNGLFEGFKEFHCKYVGFNISKIRSELYPAIPTIEIKILDPNLFSSPDYEGLSGALVYNCLYELYGMISHYNITKKVLCVIPTYCLKQFFAMSVTQDKVKSFCFSTQVCNFGTDKVDRFGHEIVNAYNITYLCSDKDVKFKKGDLIECINDNKFDEDGNILLKELNIAVPMDTYFVLDNSKHYKIKYHTKKATSYSEVTKHVQPIILDDFLKFNFEYHSKVIKYKGLVITEMSEQLLSYYDLLGIKISGLVDDYYNDCYTALGQKILIIMNVEYSKLSDNISEVYKRIGFPLVKGEIDSYFIPIVSKINDKKMNNLLDVEKLLVSDDVNLILRCEFAQRIGISLQYDGLKVFVK